MSSKKCESIHCPFPTIPEECADGWSFHFINSAKGLLTEHNNIGTTRLSLLALITPSELLNHLAPAHPQSVYWVNSRLYWMDGRGCSTRGSISIEEHEPILLTISLFQFFQFEFFLTQATHPPPTTRTELSTSNTRGARDLRATSRTPAPLLADGPPTAHLPGPHLAKQHQPALLPLQLVADLQGGSRLAVLSLSCRAWWRAAAPSSLLSTTCLSPAGCCPQVPLLSDIDHSSSSTTCLAGWQTFKGL